MICDATRHAPECLTYMSQLRNAQVFSFCAIPQIMAIATLQQCYNNGKVFEGVVKLRRGQTAKVRALH
jgi:farnesyl-diphosphate farnesyltransferase